MNVFWTLLRIASGVAALGTAVALGFGAYDLSTTGPQLATSCYALALLLMLSASGFIFLLRNSIGTILALSATLLAGPIFLGELFLLKITPDFMRLSPTGTTAAIWLGLATALLMPALLVRVLSRRQTVAKTRRQPEP